MVHWLLPLLSPALVVLACFAKEGWIAPIVRFLKSGGAVTAEAEAEAMKGRPRAPPGHKSTFIDRASFTVGVVNIGITLYVLGAAPKKFFVWHSVKMLFLLGTRFLAWRSQRLHYIMFEFCYFANVLTLVHSWIAPCSQAVFRVLFVVSNGPLAWSVFAFTNSAVFHSRSEMTSLFVHVSPMLLSYAERYHPLVPLDRGAATSVTNLFLAGLSFYGCWLIAYYVLVFVVLDKRAKKKGNTTLYDWYVTSTAPGKAIGRFHHNPLVNKTIYILIHAAISCFSLFLGALLWHSHLAHASFVIAVMALGVWNGSAFFFENLSADINEEARIRLGVGDPATPGGDEGDPEAATKCKALLDDVRGWLARRLSVRLEDVPPNAKLTELGLSSLDTSELREWLASEKNIEGAEPRDLETPTRVSRLATTAGKKSAPEVVPQEWTRAGGVIEAKPDKSTIPVRGQNIPLCFLDCVARLGNQVAVADGTTVLSYKRLMIGAALIADYVAASPTLFQGIHIGVMLPAVAAAPLVFLGLQMARKVPAMLNWTAGSRALSAMLQVADIRTVITSKKFLRRIGATADLKPLHDTEAVSLLFLEDIKESFYTFDTLWAAVFYTPSRIARRFQLHRIGLRDEAVVLFTSGSEGTPKGVPLSHENLRENVIGNLDALKLDRTHSILGVLPPFHSFGVNTTIVLPLVAGVRVAYWPDPTDYRHVTKEIAKWKPTCFLGTPTFVGGVFSNGDRADTASLQLIVTGAEKTPDTLFAEARARGIKFGIIEGYGITECSPVIAVNTPTDPPTPPRGLGKSLFNVQIAIIAMDMPSSFQRLPDGAEGMIVVSGPSVFYGYLGSVASPFVKDSDGRSWYVTGDLGRLVDGNLHLTGRLKRFVKVAGEMISLGAIEESLRVKWPNTSDGPVIAVEAVEPRTGTPPTICVFSSCGVSRDAAIEHLRHTGFAPIYFPNTTREVSSIPMLGSGKTDYVSLKKILLGPAK